MHPRLNNRQVQDLQRIINQQTETYPKLRVDGQMGKKTQRALSDAFESPQRERVQQGLLRTLGTRVYDLLQPPKSRSTSTQSKSS